MPTTITELSHHGNPTDPAGDTKTAKILDAITELTQHPLLSPLINRGGDWVFGLQMRCDPGNGVFEPYYTITIFGAGSVSAATLNKFNTRMDAVKTPDSYTRFDGPGWGAINLSYHDKIVRDGGVVLEIGDITMCFSGAREGFDILFVAEFFSRLKGIFKECYPTTSGEYPGLGRMMAEDPVLNFYFSGR